jgi:hypothetical protein
MTREELLERAIQRLHLEHDLDEMVSDVENDGTAILTIGDQQFMIMVVDITD